jgi:hypothetical protein
MTWDAQEAINVTNLQCGWPCLCYTASQWLGIFKEPQMLKKKLVQRNGRLVLKGHKMAWNVQGMWADSCYRT